MQLFYLISYISWTIFGLWGGVIWTSTF